jgi:transcriptional regulator with XRE-family HTH domain
MAYGEVLARNVRGIRSRKGLGQKSLAARMRALGYTAWFTQTVGKAERGDRRITAEEVFGLAVALEVTMRQLLEPQPDDKLVALPNGESMPVRHVQLLVAGTGNPHPFIWQDDVPVPREVTGWWGEGDHPPEEA